MSRTRTQSVLLVVGAAAVLVSGWVHFYLYFRGGYRGIAARIVPRDHHEPRRSP